MKKSFDYSIFIGRFQPFHNAHLALVREALEQAETAIVVIGSYKKAPSPKHPWSVEDREAMMRAALTAEENARIKVIYMRDYLYNETLWEADVCQKVSDITGDSESIVLVGHEHDYSSEYLRSFQQWKKHLLPDIKELPHATQIRYLYFTLDASYKKYVHPKTAEYLEAFRDTTKFKGLKNYFDAIREGKNAWAGAPFPVIFQTVDAVVLRSAHVLCVRRGKAYGGGQIALPGGFLNENERIQTGAIRELKEETSIAMSKEELTKHIKESHSFDDPQRSERGRTITTAFFIDLGNGPLLKVRGGDDAKHSWWMPISEFYTREEEFFEDHHHIVSYFIGSPFMRAT